MVYEMKSYIELQMWNQVAMILAVIRHGNHITVSILGHSVYELITEIYVNQSEINMR